jgi:hypothetical protein
MKGGVGSERAMRAERGKNVFPANFRSGLGGGGESYTYGAGAGWESGPEKDEEEAIKSDELVAINPKLVLGTLRPKGGA